jgi:hypothetical protein
LSELRGLSESLASVEVRSAALAERTSDGTLRIPEQGDAVIGAGTATGGLIGMLAGVLGGPLGVLLGFAPPDGQRRPRYQLPGARGGSRDDDTGAG